MTILFMPFWWRSKTQSDFFHCGILSLYGNFWTFTEIFIWSKMELQFIFATVCFRIADFWWLELISTTFRSLFKGALHSSLEWRHLRLLLLWSFVARTYFIHNYWKLLRFLFVFLFKRIIIVILRFFSLASNLASSISNAICVYSRISF